MFALLLIDSYTIGAILCGLLFTVFFGLLLNPPTAWVKRWAGKDKR